MAKIFLGLKEKNRITEVRSFAGFPQVKTYNHARGGGIYHSKLVPTSHNHLSLVEQSFFSDKRSDYAAVDGGRPKTKVNGKSGVLYSVPDLPRKAKLDILRDQRRGNNRFLARSMESISQANLEVIFEKENSGANVALPEIPLMQTIKRKSLAVNPEDPTRGPQRRLNELEEVDHDGERHENRTRKMRKSLDMMDGKVHMQAPKRYSLELGNSQRSREKLTESQSIHSFTSSRSRFSDSDSSRKSLQQFQNKPKVNYGAKFKRLSKFLVVLFGLWKDHARRVKDFMDTNVDLLDVHHSIDLMFDASLFSREKQASLSDGIRELLVKRPTDRANDELIKIRVALGNYQSIAEYPLHIKKMIARRAWCEIYDPKKVIVRQGHPSRYYYIILSGSVIVTKQEEGTEVSKTDCFLERGDSFGELGLINNAPRRATVISKEKVELLVFNDEDYVDIFMSGGLNDEQDSFLSSVGFLKGWPLEKLIDNPNHAYVSYFKRGMPLVLNSKYLDWLIIIKTGSCKILKKLHTTRPTSEKSNRGELKSYKILDDHETVINEHLVLAELRAEERSLSYRKRRLQELDLKIELLPLLERSKDASFALDQVSAENEALGDGMEDGEVAFKPEQDKDDDVPQSLQKEPFITKAVHSKYANMTEDQYKSATAQPSKEGTKISWADQSFSQPKGKMFRGISKKVKNAAKAVQKKKRKTIYKEKRHTIVDDLNERYLNMTRPQTAADKNPVFVRLQTLTSGMVFGLHEVLHEDQPNLSLVSNGSECVIVHKKLFESNAGRDYLRELKNETSPYPPDSYFQDSLQVYTDWKETKSDTYIGSLFKTKIGSADPNDSRAFTNIKLAIGMTS